MRRVATLLSLALAATVGCASVPARQTPVAAIVTPPSIDIKVGWILRLVVTVARDHLQRGFVVLDGGGVVAPDGSDEAQRHNGVTDHAMLRQTIKAVKERLGALKIGFGGVEPA